MVIKRVRSVRRRNNRGKAGARASTRARTNNHASSSSSASNLGIMGSIVGAAALTQGHGNEYQENNNTDGEMMMGGRKHAFGITGSQHSKSLGSSDYILSFLEMLNTIKIYHWATLSYPTHKATDDLYSKMSELVDSFIEIYIGHTNEHVRFSGAGGAGGRSGLSIPFCDCKSIEMFCKKLDEYISFLKSLTERLEMGGYTDLVNIRDEMIGALGQAKYVLRLK
jgi:hypothetical protein